MKEEISVGCPRRGGGRLGLLFRLRWTAIPRFVSSRGPRATVFAGGTKEGRKVPLTEHRVQNSDDDDGIRDAASGEERRSLCQDFSPTLNYTRHAFPFATTARSESRESKSVRTLLSRESPPALAAAVLELSLYHDRHAKFLWSLEGKGGRARGRATLNAGAHH